jgi:hypothetical protein
MLSVRTTGDRQCIQQTNIMKTRDSHDDSSKQASNKP